MAMSIMWERVLQQDRVHKIRDVDWDWECCKSQKSEVGMSRSNGSLPRVFGGTTCQLDVEAEFEQVFFKSRRTRYCGKLKDFEDL